MRSILHSFLVLLTLLVGDVDAASATRSLGIAAPNGESTLEPGTPDGKYSDARTISPSGEIVSSARGGRLPRHR